MEGLEKNIPILEKLETEYYGKYYKLLLGSHMGNAGQREAETRLTMQQEPIFEKYLDAKLIVRKLLTKKEILIEICRNLRMLEHTPIDK
jgi:hypothetical protein